MLGSSPIFTTIITIFAVFSVFSIARSVIYSVIPLSITSIHPLIRYQPVRFSCCPFLSLTTMEGLFYNVNNGYFFSRGLWEAGAC